MANENITPNEPVRTIDPVYQDIKTKLMKSVEITMERKFAEEVEFLEGLNAESMIADTFQVDYSRGLKTNEVESRRLKYGSNKKEGS